MNLIKKISLICVAMLGLTFSASAQIFWSNLVQKVNGRGDTLFIGIHLNHTEAANVIYSPGSADFRFTLDTAALDIRRAVIVKQGRWSNNVPSGGDPNEYLPLSREIGPDSASLVITINRAKTAPTSSIRRVFSLRFRSDSLSLVARVGIPIKNCSANSLVRWVSWGETGGGVPFYLDRTRANFGLVPQNEVGQGYEYSFPPVPGTPIPTPLKNSPAQPVLTCQSLAQAIRFDWNQVANAKDYVLVVTNPDGSVIRQPFPVQAGPGSFTLTRNVGQGASAVLIAAGTCAGDSSYSPASNCTAQACPTNLPAPTANIENATTPICFGESVTLRMVRTGANLTLQRPLQYSFNGGLTFGTDSVLTLNNVGASSQNPDTTVTLVIRDARGCATPVGQAVIAIRRLVNPSTQIVIANKTQLEGGPLCNNGTVSINGELQPVGSADNVALTWTTTGAGQLSSTSTPAVVYTPAAGETGTVKFVVRNTCFRLVDSVSINLAPSPAVRARFIKQNANAQTGDSAFVGIPAEFEIISPVVGTTYNWTLGDGSSATGTNVSHVYNQGGVFQITVTAITGTCTTSTVINLNVVKVQTFYMPNALAPDVASQDNNSLRVYGTGLQDADFQMMVFNRWGELVYQTSSLQTARTTGWTGRRDNAGDVLPGGTYTVAVKGKYLDGTTFEQSGNITLIR